MQWCPCHEQRDGPGTNAKPWLGSSSTFFVNRSQDLPMAQTAPEQEIAESMRVTSL